jgi:type VI secretion system protein ImpH
VDFFAAVRLVQSRATDCPRIGRSNSPSEDPIRFAQSPSLDFAPSTLEAVQLNGSRPVLYSRHFGLFGPQGPLPLALTEYARDRILHHGDRTFAAFCNVLHHRFHSFFFRAWADGLKTVDHDRPHDQHWPAYVGSLAGLGMESLLERNSVPDAAKLFFSGRLAQQARNAEGLEAIIQHFFGVKTELQSFVGGWLQLPEESACRLDGSPEHAALGATVIVGRKVWTCQLRFRLRLGPMPLVDLERLLPGQRAFRRLCDWIRQYAGDQFEWDVQLILDRTQVPEVILGKRGRLGWTSWLKTTPFEHDPADLVLNEASLPQPSSTYG